jgi:hypothetical protein
LTEQERRRFIWDAYDEAQGGLYDLYQKCPAGDKRRTLFESAHNALRDLAELAIGNDPNVS